MLISLTIHIHSMNFIRLLVLERTSSIIHNPQSTCMQNILFSRSENLNCWLLSSNEMKNRKNTVDYLSSTMHTAPHRPAPFCSWSLKKNVDAKFNDIFFLFSSAIKLILFMFVFPLKWALTLRMVNIHQLQSILCILTTLNNQKKKKTEKQ